MTIDIFGSSDDDTDENDEEIVVDRSKFNDRPTSKNSNPNPTRNKSLIEMATGKDMSQTPDDDAPSDQPTQLEMVHQKLTHLTKTFESKQFALKERRNVISQYEDIAQSLINLVGHEIRITNPEKNPSMQEMAAAISDIKQYLTPNNINGTESTDLLFKIGSCLTQ